MARARRLGYTVVGLCLLLTCRTYGGVAGEAAHINVILWFDTEDYLSPSDDDADKRLAEMLSERQLRATFKIVGEKARVLEMRGRTDVIEALKQHDIGFHANFHSVHPTVAEYEAPCGLLDGMSEFVRREGPGAADVRRIFGRKTLVCYGQPGSSWASQAIAALPQCGIQNDGVPCYVDSGDHVGFGGRPFWYCGALVVYKMQPNETRMNLFAQGGLEQGEKDVSAIAARLAREGGGLISIYYHPCEWVTSEFWDAANFTRGNNPPRSQWKLPAQRDHEQSEQAYARFGAYLDYIRAIPGIRFVTASQLPALYPDRVRSEAASDDQITEIAARMQRPVFAGSDDVESDGKVYSPADQFDLLTRAVAGEIDKKNATGATDRRIVAEALLGPDAAPPAESEAREPVPWAAFTAAVLDVRDYLQINHRIPPRVFIGTDAVAPADFLVGLGTAWLACRRSHQFPQVVSLGHNVEVLTARLVTKDSAKTFGGWIIHKPGFRAPRILEVAALQAWTLKPAVPRQSSGHLPQ